jgi:uncharacterized protein with von Willebrand factor type A (vWA) domain
MSNLPAIPLADIVARAAKTLKKSGAIAKASKRIDGVGCSAAVCVLYDVSFSMLEYARAGKRKIDLLRDAHADLRGAAISIAFAGSAQAVADLPQPGGGTALHLALDEAAKANPRSVVVITDGHPDNEVSALASARKLKGTIDVIYCGPESDLEAIGFLLKLTKLGAGRFVNVDLSRRVLAPAVRALLT